MKRHPAPTHDDIWDAIEAAMQGRTTALAFIIKSFSVEDLAKGLSAATKRQFRYTDFHLLELSLVYAAQQKRDAAPVSAVKTIKKRKRAT